MTLRPEYHPVPLENSCHGQRKVWIVLSMDTPKVPECAGVMIADRRGIRRETHNETDSITWHGPARLSRYAAAEASGVRR